LDRKSKAAQATIQALSKGKAIKSEFINPDDLSDSDEEPVSKAPLKKVAQKKVDEEEDV
jgi:hypothetical protein